MVSPIKKEGPKNYLSDEKALKRFVRQMIKNHNFVGSYIEKRYVPHLGRYIQIIQISKNEDIFIENLSIIKRRLENFYQNSKWIGITSLDTPGAPVGYSLWADINEEIFGVYRFCVRDVSFTKEWVVLKLEMIKPCKEKHTSRDSSRNKSTSSFLDSSESFVDDYEKPIITWENFKNATTFLFLLLLTITTGTVEIIKYSLDYILKLLQVSTPIIIAFFNSITKIFGYLCFLVAFLFKGNNAPKKEFIDVGYDRRLYYQPAYPYERRYKALPYRAKSSVVITELNE